jgi:hypothetical protein
LGTSWGRKHKKKNSYIMKRWVDQACLTQIIRRLGGGNINGGANIYFRQFWWELDESGKGMWILNQGLVEKEDEKVEEGVGSTRE